jgi:hypothetical protein
MAIVVVTEQDKIEMCRELGIGSPERVNRVEIVVTPGDVVRVNVVMLLPEKWRDRLFPTRP